MSLNQNCTINYLPHVSTNNNKTRSEYRQMVEFRRFDPSTIPDNSVCCFIGKRRSGKSTLLADILWHKRHIPGGIAMSGTEDGNGHYGKYIPKNFVFKDYKPDVVRTCIARQKKYQSKGLSRRMFLICDDMSYDRTLFREKTIRELFMNGRHYQMLVLLTLQWMLDMPPALRTNIDYVFLCKDNVKDNKERMYKYFAGCFDNYKHFNTIFEKMTDNHRCMVIDCTTPSSRLEDVIFYYKAEIRKPFKTGSEAFWKADKDMKKRNSEKNSKTLVIGK